MTLREALLLANAPALAGTDIWPLSLVCGFEPLHLKTFLAAHLSSRLSRRVAISTGLYGDWEGNLRRAMDGPSAPLFAVLEWADIDPRLGLREGYRPDPEGMENIPAEAAARLEAFASLLTTAAGQRRCVIALPASPLPPWRLGLAGQAHAFDLALQACLSTFALRCAEAGIRVVAPLPGDAYDLRSHLMTGFPYRIAYANQLSERAGLLLAPPVPLKGLITDLDQTLWHGVVGDDGPGQVQWSLDGKARHHGIYQQFLASLAGRGVLLGVASKNDPEPVAEALARQDLLLPPDSFFPIETHWGPKTGSIERIAAAWNIGLDAIAFVDDNPLEIEAVQSAFPALECYLFPADDPESVLALLERLRLRFARETIRDEDRIRSQSLRQATSFHQADASDPERQVAGLAAHLTIDARPLPDARALELLNKTNQFNLNGRRWEESDFSRFLSDPDAVLATVQYEDRFGPLGKIAVLTGRRQDATLHIQSWVMSCRAFSRRIEYSLLQALFTDAGFATLELDWIPTARNGPTRDTLASLFSVLPGEPGLLSLSREEFFGRSPRLYAACKWIS